MSLIKVKLRLQDWDGIFRLSPSLGRDFLFSLFVQPLALGTAVTPRHYDNTDNGPIVTETREAPLTWHICQVSLVKGAGFRVLRTEILNL